MATNQRSSEGMRPRPGSGPGAAEREPVARALDMLAWVAAENRESWSVRGVAREIEVSPATVHRIFRSLESRNLLRRVDDGTYVLGLEFVRMSAHVLRQFSLGDLARPYLINLTSITGESSLFGIYDEQRSEMMFTERVDSPHPLHYLVGLHQWRELYAGATGLSILAFLPLDQRQAVYARNLKALTGRTLTSGDTLEAAAERIRQTGYACTQGQRTAGAVGLGVPVLDSDGLVLGNICLTLPEQRFSPEREPELAGYVTAAAKALSAQLADLSYSRRLLPLGPALDTSSSRAR
jgi:IclR family transcriptional regulator, acetate operon repressor